MVRVAINGFGRIGRLVLRALFDDPQITVSFVNDVVQPDLLAYLLQHDTVHGKWEKHCRAEGSFLVIDNKRIQVCSERDPKDLASVYKEIPVDITIEASGLFTSKEKAMGHIAAGAKRVVITAPSADAPMFVMGVNHLEYDPETDIVVSNASCTTNCLAPLVKVLHQNFGVIEGLMTTVHAVTATQKTVDAPAAKDWRGSRSAFGNIIPSTTGAAKAVGKILPSLEGRLTGMAFRVPVLDVSVVDLTVRLEKGAGKQTILEVMQQAALGDLKGILGVTQEEVVSADFVSNKLSCIYDHLASIELNQHFHKIVAWYDNEWGYANRVVDLVRYMSQVNGSMRVNASHVQ